MEIQTPDYRDRAEVIVGDRRVEISPEWHEATIVFIQKQLQRAFQEGAIAAGATTKKIR